jgi:Reverse transcriptase (RNA-dependent DNA polymerase)
MTDDTESDDVNDRLIWSLRKRDKFIGISTVTSTYVNRSELDSHADTCVGGSNCVLIETNGEVATVFSFSKESTPFDKIAIGTIATSWTNEIDGETIVLLFPESLYFGDRLPHSLLCPNQMRAYGTRVEDVPRQYDISSGHSIQVQDIVIPLDMDGVISYFESRKPTDFELDNCRRVTLTSDTKWNPSDPTFADQERILKERVQLGIASISRSHVTPPELMHPCEYEHRLISCVYISLDEDSDTVLESTQGRAIQALATTEQKSVLTKEALAKRWGIGLPTADRTLRVTTQRGIRTFLRPTDRRLSTSLPHLSYSVINRTLYSDTMFAKVKSLHGNASAQVWTDGQGYALLYPIKSKSLAYTTVQRVIHEMNAIPKAVITDNAMEETGGNWKKEMQHYRIHQKFSEPYSQWQNRAEGEIRELKRVIRRTMQREKVPKRLWDYCGQWAAGIRRRTALDLSSLHGVTPEESVHGRAVDISSYAQFNFYSLVWYIDTPGDAATPRRKIGRWIGVANDIGSSLTYYVLPKSCRPIPRSSVMPLTPDELLQPEIKSQILEYDAAIKEKIGDDREDDDVAEDIGELPPMETNIFADDVDDVDPVEEPMVEADTWTPESYDQYISVKVLLPRGETQERAVVKRRSKDEDGNPIGIRNANPILDTREYEIEFPDGSIDILTANMIAESMYSQIDSEGHHTLLINEISDHATDGSAVKTDDGFVPGTQQRRWTTKGWKLLVEWKDGTNSWVPLKDIKHSNPLEVAEYAVANKLVSEPAFAWWVPKVLRQRDRNIMKVRSRYLQRSHKYGIEVPTTVDRALQVDEENGNHFWRSAIEKEMLNNSSAFEILPNGMKVPIGYTKIRCHMIFDVKMDFTRKARFVAGGHLTDPPKETVYSSVVTRESVRIFFLICALNDLDVLACDVQNAYLNATTKEKNWFIAGPELGGDNIGKSVLIVRALYGLRSSGAQWREHLATTLRNAEFVSCKADPDVWLRAAVKSNGDKYYEYVLCYVDDILCGSEKPNKIMDYLSQQYTLKKGSVKEPDVYLGADIKKFVVGRDEYAWGISPDTYCKTAVTEVERKLSEIGKKLASKISTPMTSNYRPELDSTPLLKPEQASYYQSLIGILRWAVELGRVDIIVETGKLSRYCVAPRLGHLDEVFHIFAYLKRNSSCSMVFNWAEPVIDESIFKVCDWTSQYPGAIEAIPPSMPVPRGKPVVTRCYVDADHAGCLATRRSHTGVLIFINQAPIVWFSKRQNTVESSTFGSEFIALKQSIDLIEGLRYKLRMMGIPIDDTTSIYCDNEAVVRSTTAVESTLKKKHNAICYHRSREAQAAGHIRVGKIPGPDNLADAFTKVIVGQHRAHLYSQIFLHPPGVGNFGNEINSK